MIKLKNILLEVSQREKQVAQTAFDLGYKVAPGLGIKSIEDFEYELHIPVTKPTISLNARGKGFVG